MPNAFNTFKHYGNFEYFALSLHIKVKSSQLRVKQFKDDYNNFCSAHPFYDDECYIQAGYLQDKFLHEQSELKTIQDIEDMFVSFISDEAKNSLPYIWKLAEDAVAKQYQRKAG